jgi:hypothetical protein
MTRYLLAFFLLTSTAAIAQEGAPTQALIAFDSKTPETISANVISLKVDNRNALTTLAPIPAGSSQVALLIDDGLRTSMGRELSNLKAFILGLPEGTEVFVGYMQNGRVVSANDATAFTANRAVAAQSLRIPTGIPGASASPYFCLSDFVKNWPSNAESATVQADSRPVHKARFVLMITNGVDPYNGSTSPLNQTSPYVDNAVLDAQRAGVPVYSIYFSDAGFGRRGSFSGQSYLAEMAQGTGGVAFYLGTGSPTSTAPYLQEFKQAIADTYVATFPAELSKKTVRLKVTTTLPKTKVRAPEVVRPGTIVASN